MENMVHVFVICVHLCVCLCVCVRACMHACVHVCVCAYMHIKVCVIIKKLGVIRSG